uniref:Regulatory protein zeste n=1 Tax=Romanomermis culicivorax TaxID=13658 RepID=A0A915II52_ROMCU
MSAKRETTFSTEETYLLIECVAQQINILENKRTDAVSNGAKKKAWKNIAEFLQSKSELQLRVRIVTSNSMQRNIDWRTVKPSTKDNQMIQVAYIVKPMCLVSLKFSGIFRVLNA